ncbi:MAG: hypothetical protein M3228_04740 [Actinomycetota bacterium]|nr:hypothetical protein [Actinomycetota bacterium]
MHLAAALARAGLVGETPDGARRARRCLPMVARSFRRFMFEGRECGGHVGPRASFPLWKIQVQRLLEYDDAQGRADELQVLFAGGSTTSAWRPWSPRWLHR